MTEDGTRAAARLATRNPRIAIVEDDQVYRSYLSLLFKGSNCRVSEAETGRELLDILAAEDVDCVVLDYMLPAENGLSIHAQIRETMRDPPPIVLLTAERNARTIIKAFRGGISDYLLKDGLKPDEIFLAVSAAMERRAAARAHEAELARLKRNAVFDDATGLYSRASIDDRLVAVAGGGRDARCAVVLMRFDNLDAIRIVHGLVVADRAWRVFLSRVKEALDVHDVGGRYDQTRLIAVADVDVRVKSVAQRCRSLAAALAADIVVGAIALRPTISVGGAIYPLDGGTLGDVLAAAERALDECSRCGAPYVLAGSGVETAEPAAAREDAPAGDPAGVSPAIGGAAARSLTARASDRRADVRHRVLKRGRIVLPNLSSLVDCVVRDVSRGGARLRVEGSFVAPDQFDLVVLVSGERRRVSRRWQIGSEFGVQFVD